LNPPKALIAHLFEYEFYLSVVAPFEFESGMQLLLVIAHHAARNHNLKIDARNVRPSRRALTRR
jgi:hypothetical protein